MDSKFVVGKRLKLCLRLQGMSQTAFAREAGIEPNKLSQWITGAHMLPPEFASDVFAAVTASLSTGSIAAIRATCPTNCASNSTAEI